jgi:hypothetical protein
VHGIEKVGSLLADHFPAAAGDRKHHSGGVAED